MRRSAKRLKNDNLARFAYFLGQDGSAYSLAIKCGCASVASQQNGPVEILLPSLRNR
jgi:hypothetical protein